MFHTFKYNGHYIQVAIDETTKVETVKVQNAYHNGIVDVKSVQAGKVFITKNWADEYFSHPASPGYPVHNPARNP